MDDEIDDEILPKGPPDPDDYAGPDVKTDVPDEEPLDDAGNPPTDAVTEP